MNNAELAESIKDALDEWPKAKEIPVTFSREELVLIVDLLSKALRPEDGATSKLRGFVDVVDHLRGAVWIDKDGKEHPAVTPLVSAYAGEFKEFLASREPQSNARQEKE